MDTVSRAVLDGVFDLGFWISRKVSHFDVSGIVYFEYQRAGCRTDFTQDAVTQFNYGYFHDMFKPL